jgi:prepilin-type processing-associated H-X9-DG protein
MNGSILKVLAGLGLAGFACAAPLLLSTQTIRWVTTGQAARADASDSASVAAVKRFLHARDERDTQSMYGLLSADTRKMGPYQEYAKGDGLKGIDSAKPPLSDVVRAIAFLFLDTQNQRQYTYTLAGTDPKDPSVVLVNGGPSGATQTMALRIFTVQDPDGKTRLDLMKTVLTADPNLKPPGDQARQVADETNLKQIGLGILQYAQDHDNHLPDADKWVDEVYPYIKNDAVFHDPSDKPDHLWSYAYNRALSGKLDARIASPADTVLVFDSSLGTKNASDTGESIPRPGRHHGGSDILFADGHVKWFADASVPTIHK